MIELLLAFSPVVGLAVNALSLVVLFRIRPRFGLLRAEYVGFVVGVVIVLGLNAFAVSRQVIHGGGASMAGYGILTLSTYAALGYCHFHFVNLGETARRIRLLREFMEAGGTLSHDELLSRYTAREVVEKRLARLINSGQIVHSRERYYIGNPFVLRIAQLMVSLKVLLLGKKSEHAEE